MFGEEEPIASVRAALDATCTVLPDDWPGRDLEVHPADFTAVIQQGLGFSGPVVMRPWDTLDTALGARDYYALQRNSAHPVLNAPLTSPSGGTVYFGDSVDAEDLGTLLRLVGVHARHDDAIVAYGEAADPKADGYLHQMRVLSRFGLKRLFGAVDGDLPPKREPAVSVGAIIRAFVDFERRYWRDGYAHSAKLRGAAGGDGNWAKEALAFGLSVENPDNLVYRVWSRAWLVTK